MAYIYCGMGTCYAMVVVRESSGSFPKAFSKTTTTRYIETITINLGLRAPLSSNETMATFRAQGYKKMAISIFIRA